MILVNSQNIVTHAGNIIIKKGFIRVNGKKYSKPDMTTHTLHNVTMPENFMVSKITYENGVFTQTTEALQSEISKAKRNKINLFAEQAENLTELGYESDALGEAHSYSGSLTEQVILLNMAITKGNHLVLCLPADEDWTYKEHSQPQITAVLEAGVVDRGSILNQLISLKQQINKATTLTEINSIEWA